MAAYQKSLAQYVSTANTIFAYRRFGPPTGVPLVLMQHFRGTMEHWDPLLLYLLAVYRPLIVFDNAGIGASTGTIPRTFAGWAADAIAFVSALGLMQIDLLGYSMSGAAAQMFALNAPHGMVRKLILAGTRASQSDRTVAGPPGPFAALFKAQTDEESEAALACSFYPETEEGRAHAKAYWTRITLANNGVIPSFLGREDAKIQAAAFVDWSTPNPNNSVERLGELKMPVFVFNGDDDVLIPTVNSCELREKIEGSQMMIYPKSGHGFLVQYAEDFAERVRLFLDGDVGRGGEKAKL